MFMPVPDLPVTTSDVNADIASVRSLREAETGWNYFRYQEVDNMKLVGRLRHRVFGCCHQQSALPQSEIGHDTLRHYFWVCGKCGARVYIEDWKSNAENFLA